MATSSSSSVSAQVSSLTATETPSVAHSTPPVNIPSINSGLRTPEKSLGGSSEEGASPSSLNAESPLGDGLDASPGKLKKRNRCYSCRKKVGLTGKMII